MKRRRRRFLRDDVLAPWLTLGVILGVWWLGASALRPAATARTAAPVQRPSHDAVYATDPARREAVPHGERVDIPTVTDRAMPAPEESTDVPSVAAGGDVGELLQLRLSVPVAGVDPKSLRSTFRDSRSGGRTHEAMDIMAPRGTPVLAAGEGRIAKLFTSALGGLTIYQFDPDERYCYYYAHLDSYSPDIAEGQMIKRGQTIGYVGTTGNAPAGSPHLHFAIFKLGAEKRWWDGAPIDPFLVLR